MALSKDAECLLGFLKPVYQFEAQPNILDVGRDNIRVALELVKKGYEVTAICENSGVMNSSPKSSLNTPSRVFSNTSEKPVLRLLEISLENYEADRMFDGICCFGIFHYYKTIIDVSNAVHKISSLIRKNGIVILSWISEDSLRGKNLYLPSSFEVFGCLQNEGWLEEKSWSQKIVHSHGDLPMHAHTVEYSAWRKI